LPCTLAVSRAIIPAVDPPFLTVADSLCVEAFTTNVI
jgi:hypothetical protein